MIIEGGLDLANKPNDVYEAYGSGCLSFIVKVCIAKDDVQTAHEDLHYDIMKNIDSNSPESPEQ
ncbi:hypothetical protein F2Q68_00024956 [Brassica cretica]|uniref:Uncharacterized protein n=1 Tax=Brassica cretica TaxID=69181 RepID=A0A8S9II73_BRACR|nr:hypothetical protein F2Q68_00024956 [Brassica cretica]